MAKTTFAKKKPEDYEDIENDIEDSKDDTALLSDNAESVPLFADSDGRSLRSIAYLKLSKLEDKGWAYKGQIPLSSTNETIGQVYGDGVYTIEGCNKKHKVLDTKENIRISLGYDSPKEKQLSLAAVPTDNTAEFDRIERLATSAANEAKELSKAYTTMVATQTEATLAREMKFMEATTKQQSDFMSGMMAMQAQSFQQTMAIMATGHAQNIAQLKASAGDKEKAPGIKEMMELFMSGINVAQQLSGDVEEDEELPLWQEILQGGVGLLGSLAKNKVLSANAESDNPSANSTPAEPTKIRSSGLSARDVKKRKILVESLRLRALVRSSGLSMAEATRRLKAESPAPTPEPDEEDADTDEDEDESDDDSPDSFDSEESEGTSGTN